MNVVFASEVWGEVDNARDYYKNEVEGLGKAFVHAIYDSIEELKDYRDCIADVSHWDIPDYFCEPVVPARAA